MIKKITFLTYNFNVEIKIFAFSLLFFTAQFASADTQILIIRHGEKPAQGLGQLSCKGFNRSLALPNIIINRYGKSDAIIVPNPGVQKADKGVPYAYIRPLATVEPLAVLLEK